MHRHVQLTFLSLAAALPVLHQGYARPVESSNGKDLPKPFSIAAQSRSLPMADIHAPARPAR